MEQITNFLFSPLEASYCNYFYVLSIFGFVFFMMAVINFLLRLINPAKKNNNMHLLYHFTLMIQTFLAYFLNRLLFSMCKGSLN